MKTKIPQRVSKLIAEICQHAEIGYVLIEDIFDPNVHYPVDADKDEYVIKYFPMVLYGDEDIKKIGRV